MLDSLYTGTAGIKANSTALGIVGANIANVNTVGYKTANTSFQNVLSTAMGSGRLGSKEVWNQGSLEQTAVTTDFAIVGDGLFQLKDATGGAYYTRDGSFNLDENGLLTNTAGMKVQGFKIGNAGEIGAAGDIRIANVNSSPVATEKMGLDFNLDGQYRAASVMVDCTDNFSSITYTARTPGGDGNDTNVRYIDSGSGGPVVSSEGSSLTIDMGGQDLTASQAAAMVNAYFNVAAETKIGAGAAAVQFVANAAGTEGNNIQVQYVPASAGSTLGVNVQEFPSGTTTITVTIVEGTTTAKEIAEAVNADAEASVLLTAISKGVGAVSVMTGTNTNTIGTGDEAVSFMPLVSGVGGEDIYVEYVDAGTPVKAAATIGTGNAAVTFTANADGEVGNDIQIEYVTDDVKAVGTLGAGDALVNFEAKVAGVDGNMKVEYVDNGTGGLLISVAGTSPDTITVNLGGGSFTAAEVAAAINADATAGFQVLAWAANNGAGNVSTGETTLKGGIADGDVIVDANNIKIGIGATTTADNIKSWVEADTDAFALVTVASGGPGVVSFEDTAVNLTGGINSGEVVVEEDASDGSKTIKVGIDGSSITAANIAAAINADGDASTLVFASVGEDSGGYPGASGPTQLVGGTFALEIGQNYLLNGSASKTLGEGDAAVLFVANTTGSDGNGIQVEYVIPSPAVADVTVTVVDTQIRVSLVEGCSASDIADKINGNAAASALVTAYAGGNGEVPFGAVSNTNLEGGKSSDLIPPAQVTAVASGDGSGFITVSAPVTLSGGSEPEDYSTTIGVYDSLGNQIDLTVDYIFNPVMEMDADENLNTVSQWFWSVRSSEGKVEDISGVLRFDSSGQLDRVRSTCTDSKGTENLRDGGNPKIVVTDLNSGAAELTIDWDLSITTNVTGFSGLSEVTGQSQNGYASGSLTELSVDEDGVISGTFSNGATRDLYQVGVASFQNYDGLALKGTNVFTATEDSGAAMFGEAGSGGRGSISSGSLELSNVDLAEEFVNMITIQRAYQANSRVITTSSDILNELINLKR